MANFFKDNFQTADAEVYNFTQQELNRQQNNIELIASENIVSKAVLEAQGSILTNKYAEGYPSRRYYGGCQYVDEIESLAIERVKKLFKVEYANVQPHSGSQANMAVYLGLLQPFDMVMGMDLNAGGHLTHGSPVSFSGKLYKTCSYNVDPKTFLIDYNEVEKIAVANSPKMIIAGGSSYSRIVDFAKFQAIAKKVGAYLMVDMAHFAGLIVGGEYPSPVPYADVITSTTHKTLRGPRGGLILSNNKDIMKKINSAVFPGSQGGPLMHVIAAKAVAFKEALGDSYKTYAKNVVKNSKTMAKAFVEKGIEVTTGGTDSHLFLVNVNSKLGLNGNQVEKILDTINITCNKNSLPYDALPPSKTSGIRIGTPAITTRGFKEADVVDVANIIIDVLKLLKPESEALDTKELSTMQSRVKNICDKFPIY